MNRKKKGAEKSRKIAAKRARVRNIEKMSYWELADVIADVHRELKDRNPIGVNMYTSGLYRAEKDLAEIAAAEVDNPTSESGPEPGPRPRCVRMMTLPRSAKSPRIPSFLNLAMNQALGVWSELEQAYFGKNSFGGNTAEIYAYRLQQHDPSVGFGEDTETGRQALKDQAEIAGRNLFDLLQLFVEFHKCKVNVDGTNPEILLLGFSHRCHVKIIREDK